MADHGDAGRILQLAIERLQPAGAADRDRRDGVVSDSRRVLTRTRSPVDAHFMRGDVQISGLPAQTPVATSKPHRCHGQSISLPIRSPSASGPPRCGQVLSVAKKPCAVWYSAIVRPFTSYALARPTGRSRDAGNVDELHQCRTGAKSSTRRLSREPRRGIPLRPTCRVAVPHARNRRRAVRAAGRRSGDTTSRGSRCGR